MIKETIYSRLTGNTEVSAYVTDSNGTRIYLERWPLEDKTFPKIIYSTSNREVVSSYTGRSGLASYDVELSILAENPESCTELASLVHDLFEDTSWQDSNLPAVQGSFLQSEDDSPQLSPLDDDWVVWEMDQTYKVWIEDRTVLQALSYEYIYGSTGESGASDRLRITFNTDIDVHSSLSTSCEIQTTEGGGWASGLIDTVSLISARIVEITTEANSPIYGVRWTSPSAAFIVDAITPATLVVTPE